MANILNAWRYRLLISMTLFFTADILWWSSNPPQFSLGTWLTRMVLYIALGTIVGDLLDRFQVGDGFGVILVAGVYGLLHGTLIMQSTFTNLPASLLATPLGLLTFGSGALSLMLIFWWLDGKGFRPERAAMLAVIGLIAGVWLRWYPQTASTNFDPFSLPTMLTYLAVSLIILGVLLQLLRRPQGQLSLTLTLWEALVIGIVLVLAFHDALIQDTLSGIAGAILGSLLGYFIVVLYVLKDQPQRSYVEQISMGNPIIIWGSLAYGIVIMLGVTGAYLLVTSPPPDGFGIPLILIGILWPPVVSLGVGFRAYIRMFRQGG